MEKHKPDAFPDGLSDPRLFAHDKVWTKGSKDRHEKRDDGVDDNNRNKDRGKNFAVVIAEHGDRKKSDGHQRERGKYRMKFKEMEKITEPFDNFLAERKNFFRTSKFLAYGQNETRHNPRGKYEFKK